VTLAEIKKLLDADVIVGEDHLNIEVETAFGADLMSDVLAFATHGCLLITGLTNPQCVRIAYTLDIAAIILVRGKKPQEQAVQLARELGIPVLATKYILFEACGKLYRNGIVGCIRKVGEDVESCRK